jgi:hypothetical protein
MLAVAAALPRCARLAMQIHDELLLEVEEGQAPWVRVDGMGRGGGEIHNELLLERGGRRVEGAAGTAGAACLAGTAAAQRAPRRPFQPESSSCPAKP